MKASREYVENLQFDRARLDVELQKNRRQAEMVQARIHQLEAAVTGLDFLIQQYGDEAVASANGWGNISRREGVLRVLRDATKPLLPAEIANVLREHGRKDNASQVSGALYGLRVAMKAEPLPNSGGWISLDSPAPDSEPAVTATTDSEGARLTLDES